MPDAGLPALSLCKLLRRQLRRTPLLPACRRIFFPPYRFRFRAAAERRPPFPTFPIFLSLPFPAAAADFPPRASFAFCASRAYRALFFPCTFFPIFLPFSIRCRFRILHGISRIFLHESMKTTSGSLLRADCFLFTASACPVRPLSPAENPRRMAVSRSSRRTYAIPSAYDRAAHNRY